MPIRPPVHRPHAPSANHYDRQRGTSTERGYDGDWRRCRAAFLGQNPLCKFCEQRGLLVAAAEIDHVRTIAEAPELRLDFSNLRALCRPCHARRTALEQSFGRGAIGRAHPNWIEPAQIPVTIVCGPPAAGKSSYVRLRAAPTDLVIDLDEIAAELSGSTPHTWDRARWLAPALHARNALIGKLASARVGWERAWLIVSEPEARHRQWWMDRLKPKEIVVLETNFDLCIARLKDDPERLPVRAASLLGIRTWFVRYQRRAGDVVVTTTSTTPGGV